MILHCFTSKLFLKHLTCRHFKTPLYSSIKLEAKYSEDSSSKIKLNDETIHLLEKLALVNFENDRNVNIVESAIEFANGIQSVDTSNIEPLVTVLEDRSLKLREDLVTDGKLRNEVLKNAAVVEDDYFIAPPGNIPYSFMKPRMKGNSIASYEYGPLGELLCHNIINEWNAGNVIVRDNPTFPFYRLDDSKNFLEGIKKPFIDAKSMTQNSLPFSLTCSRIPAVYSEDTETRAEESKYIRPSKTTEFKSLTFTTPQEGRQFFHFWQRQRKIWWRKFSANPGRFSLTEIKNDGNVEYTDIQAKFDWGVESIETIRFFPESIFDDIPAEQQEEWMFKIRKKKILPNVIEATTNLDTAAFCFLCDAFIEDVSLDNSTTRQLFKFHRKLAPYKVSFVVDSSGTSHREDLKLLAEYLALNVKKVGISALHIPLLCINPVEEMFKYYDLIGIPYVVVLKSSTLTDGIFGLRSRETTLQELLHINNLPEHLEKLLRNY